MKKIVILVLISLFGISAFSQVAGYTKLPKLGADTIKGIAPTGGAYDGTMVLKDTVNIGGLQDSGVIFTGLNGRLTTDTGHFIWYPVQHVLAIGGNPYKEVAPFGIDLHGFEVIYDSASGTQAIMQLTSYVNNPSIHIRSAKGSQARPLPLDSGDATFSIGIRPHGHTRFTGSDADIQGFMLEDATDTTKGNYIVMGVTRIGEDVRRELFFLYSDSTHLKNSLIVDSAMYAGKIDLAARTETTINVTAGDYMILVDATAGNVTVNLPPAAANFRREITVMKVDASGNTVTIDADAGELINGATTLVISTQWVSQTAKCNATAWFTK